MLYNETTEPALGDSNSVKHDLSKDVPHLLLDDNTPDHSKNTISNDKSLKSDKILSDICCDAHDSDNLISNSDDLRDVTVEIETDNASHSMSKNTPSFHSETGQCFSLSHGDKLAAQEINGAEAMLKNKSLSYKTNGLSKSVSPPTWFSWGNSVLDSKKSNIYIKSKFSSLSNLVDNSMDANHDIISSSVSMNDIDKLDIHHQSTLFRDIQRLKGDSSDLQSSLSNSLAELDVYDTIKQESIILDNTHIAGEGEEDSKNLLKTIREQQYKIKKLEYELDVANGTIKHVYNESTKNIHDVSVKYEDKIAHIDKQFIECIKEKNIQKISLDECMEARKKLQSNKESLIKSLSNQADENERLRAKLHMSTDDCVKLKKELDIKCSIVTELKTHLKKLQDDLSSASIKVQWANTKLKSETDAHQLTRAKLATMDAKIRQSKEEANMIRANCQAMIDKYQNSEEIQSNALGTKLEKLEAEHENMKMQFNTMKQKYEDKCIETEQISQSMDRIKDQLFEKEDAYRKVLSISKNQENDNLKLTNDLEDLDERLNSYNELKAELKNAYQNNQLLDQSIIEMREKIQLLESSNKEFIAKEKKNLDYFQKISSKNADLQLEVNSMKIEFEGTKKQLDLLIVERNELSLKFTDISGKYSTYLRESESSLSQLKYRINELENCKEELKNQIQDLKNDAQILKRKHQADNKDLIRQIEEFRKQFERQEESMKRSESFNSIESTDHRKVRSGTSSDADETGSTSNDSGTTMSLENARVLLIERLCAVQRQLAKRQEKVEFFESHINTLTKEIQKKSAVIQTLLLRVETGERTSLVGESYKQSKFDAWGQPSNGMTLKLSIEINEKLQQVLEDTLYKNITLKENIKTLGDEVDKLKK